MYYRQLGANNKISKTINDRENIKNMYESESNIDNTQLFSDKKSAEMMVKMAFFYYIVYNSMQTMCSNRN